MMEKGFGHDSTDTNDFTTSATICMLRSLASYWEGTFGMNIIGAQACLQNRKLWYEQQGSCLI